MIYEFPAEDDPIRQGDMFRCLPRVELSLRRMPVLADGDRVRELPWTEAARSSQPVTAVIAARPVTAIVVSQDCDALRAPDVTLCEIREFRDVERKSRETESAKSWMRIITQHAQINQKWFYLPPDPRTGFCSRMGVDFMVTLCIARDELLELRDLRVGRLNEYAKAHFRERIAHFFRRFPYDEWYSLGEEEMAAYRRDHPDAEPHPWQVGGPEEPTQ